MISQITFRRVAEKSYVLGDLRFYPLRRVTSANYKLKTIHILRNFGSGRVDFLSAIAGQRFAGSGRVNVSPGRVNVSPGRVGSVKKDPWTTLGHGNWHGHQHGLKNDNGHGHGHEYGHDNGHGH